MVKARAVALTTFALLVLAAGLLPMAAARAEAAGKPTRIRLQAGVEVDASGRVTAVDRDPASRLPDVLWDKARDAIQNWRFKPVLQEGVAVGGKTWANIDVCLVPVSDNSLNVAVSLASNGPGEIANRRALPMPPLPPGIIGRMPREGYEFGSRFRYRVLPDGRAELLEAQLLDPDLQGRYGVGWQREVKRWLSQRRFRPEVIDGQPVATVMEMPLMVKLSTTRSLREVKEHVASRDADSTVCRSAAGKAGNEAIAVDSQFELLPQG